MENGRVMTGEVCPEAWREAKRAVSGRVNAPIAPNGIKNHMITGDRKA
jgi:hypothetical protein